jgi:hypothetical protein
MDEIRLIRSQLATERQRAASIVELYGGLLRPPEAQPPGGAAASEALRHACLEYLRCVLSAFDARDGRLRALAARLPAGDPARATIERALSDGGGGEALGRLEPALRARAPPGPSHDSVGVWQEFAAWFECVWRPRHAAVDVLLASNARVADWRLVAGIDADSIVEERALCARVRAQLPAGLELPAAPGP